MSVRTASGRPQCLRPSALGQDDLGLDQECRTFHAPSTCPDGAGRGQQQQATGRSTKGRDTTQASQRSALLPVRSPSSPDVQGTWSRQWQHPTGFPGVTSVDTARRPFWMRRERRFCGAEACGMTTGPGARQPAFHVKQPLVTTRTVQTGRETPYSNRETTQGSKSPPQLKGTENSSN